MSPSRGRRKAPCARLLLPLLLPLALALAPPPHLQQGAPAPAAAEQPAGPRLNELAAQGRSGAEDVLGGPAPLTAPPRSAGAFATGPVPRGGPLPPLPLQPFQRRPHGAWREGAAEGEAAAGAAAVGVGERPTGDASPGGGGGGSDTSSAAAAAPGGGSSGGRQLQSGGQPAQPQPTPAAAATGQPIPAIVEPLPAASEAAAEAAVAPPAAAAAAQAVESQGAADPTAVSAPAAMAGPGAAGTGGGGARGGAGGAGEPGAAGVEGAAVQGGEEEEEDEEPDDVRWLESVMGGAQEPEEDEGTPGPLGMQIPVESRSGSGSGSGSGPEPVLASDAWRAAAQRPVRLPWEGPAAPEAAAEAAGGWGAGAGAAGGGRAGGPGEDSAEAGGRTAPPEPRRADSAAEAEATEEPAPLNFPVWWFAPFWSGSGYSSEAINYVLSLTRDRQVRRQDLWLGHHGDSHRESVVAAMAPDDREELRAMEAAAGKPDPAPPGSPPAPPRPSVVVCHSLPTNWQLPEPTSGPSDQCPPEATKHGYVYLVGRTMFETDRLPGVFVSRCNAMNEIWVPSRWAVDVFTASGVDPSKLVVVPEGVNTTWFDPALYEPMPLPQGDLVFGDNATAADPPSGPLRRPFRLLSTFKWEPRKGWDVLLEAYLSEFTAEDEVELYIITKPFVGGGDFKQHMHTWLKRAQRRLGLPPDVLTAPGRLPRLYVISAHISDADFPRYYKAVDAFVLPSRGEGWGRPHVEAMAMGLPLIATNWSGITAYLDHTVGYPIAVERLTTVSDNSVWWFRGLKWAQPSVKHTRQLMRHVYSHRDEARAKGAAARLRMVTRYSPPVLAREVAAHLRRIDALIPPLPPPE